MVQVPSVFHIDDVTEKIIKEKAAPTGETEIINYRDWKTIQFKSPVYKIPLEFCLFRTDNGRKVRLRQYVESRPRNSF